MVCFLFLFSFFFLSSFLCVYFLYDSIINNNGDEFHGDGVGMGLQPMGMGLKLMGWGRGNFCGDGADVHYHVTLYSISRGREMTARAGRFIDRLKPMTVTSICPLNRQQVV